MSASPVTPVIFAFAGQGSQYYQMARELYVDNAYFRTVMDEGNHVIEDATGYSVLAALYGDMRREQPLVGVQLASLSLLLVQWSAAMLAMSWGVTPVAVIGYSIGEIVAAVVTHALTLGDAARVLAAQAAGLQRRCEPGYMLAVLAPLRTLFPERIADEAYVACRNSSDAFVLAGPRRELMARRSHAREVGCATHVLPVEFAFHSPLIDAVAADLDAVARGIHATPPRIDCVSCASRGLRTAFDADGLWEIIRKDVDMPRTVEFVQKRWRWAFFLDLSPSGTMLNLLRKNGALDGGSFGEALLQPMREQRVSLRRVEEALRTVRGERFEALRGGNG